MYSTDSPGFRLTDRVRVVAAALVLVTCVTAWFGLLLTGDETAAASVAPDPPTEAWETVPCRDMISSAAVRILDEPVTECGYVSVPERWDKPAGAQIRLATYRIASVAERPSEDPVFVLHGGPGLGSWFAAGSVARGLGGFREHSDVIVIAQRGAGFSQPSLACPESPETLSRAEAENLGQCHARLVDEGVNLNAYTTANIARDVEGVATAMGFREWNIYGISYGALVALTAADQPAPGLRSVILDSVPPAQKALLGPESVDGVFESLDGIERRCAQDSSCAEEFGNLGDLIEDGIERLANGSIGGFTAANYVDRIAARQAEPDTAEFVHAVATLADHELEALLAALEPRRPNLSASEVETRRADGADFSQPFSGPAEAKNDPRNSLGMFHSIVCGEDWPHLEPAASDPASPLRPTTIAAVLDSAQMNDGARCVDWPVAPRESRRAVATDVPALVLVGDADSTTPTEWARLTLATLSSGQLVQVADVGHQVVESIELTHGAPGTDCTNQMLADFLANPRVQVDQGCLAKLEPARFTAG